MIVACCEKCAERMGDVYFLDRTRAPKEMGVCQWCMPQRRALLSRYEATPKRSRRRGKAESIPGGSVKDTRAQWRGPWRER